MTTPVDGIPGRDFIVDIAGTTAPLTPTSKKESDRLQRALENGDLPIPQQLPPQLPKQKSSPRLAVRRVIEIEKQLHGEQTVVSFRNPDLDAWLAHGE